MIKLGTFILTVSTLLLGVHGSFALVPKRLADAKAYLREVNDLHLETKKSMYMLSPETNAVVVIDQATNERNTIPVGTYPISISKSDNWIYVLNYEDATVSVLDRKSKSIKTTFAAPTRAHMLKVQGEYGYAINERVGVMIFDCRTHEIVNVLSFDTPVDHVEVAGLNLYVFQRKSGYYSIDVYPLSGDEKAHQKLTLDASLINCAIYEGTLYILTSCPGKPNKLLYFNDGDIKFIIETELFGQMVVGLLNGHRSVCIAGYRDPTLSIISLHSPKEPLTFFVGGRVDRLLLEDERLSLCLKMGGMDVTSFMPCDVTFKPIEGQLKVRPLFKDPLQLRSLDRFIRVNHLLYMESKEDRRIYVLSEETSSFDALQYSGHKGKLTVYKGSFYLDGRRIHPYLTMSGHLRKISQESP